MQARRKAKAASASEIATRKLTSAHSTREVLEHLLWRNGTCLLLLDRGIRAYLPRLLSEH
jgi:hypothetical protein